MDNKVIKKFFSELWDAQDAIKGNKHLNIRKNILDLHFQKYLIIASTSAIVAFTYIIGVGIAFIKKSFFSPCPEGHGLCETSGCSRLHSCSSNLDITKQITIDLFSLSILIIFSVIVFGICSILFFYSLFHIKSILGVLKNLK